MPVAAQPERYTVGDLLLDVGEGIVARRGERLPLPPRTFELLLALVRRFPGRVRRRELLETVWPDEVVSDQTLSHRVLLLRKALDDDFAHPRYLASDRGWGYHLVAPVERVEEPLHPGLAREPRPSAHWRVLGVAGVLTLAAGALALLLSGPTRSPTAAGHSPTPLLVVVDEIETTSGDEAASYVADHLDRRIASTLAAEPSLRITGAVPSDGTIPRARLGGVLESTTTGVSLTLRLSEPGSGRVLWARSERGSVYELLAVEQRLTQEVALSVRRVLDLPPRGSASLAMRAQVDDLCLRGEWLLRSWHGPALRRAIRIYESALALDEASARAHAGLSLAHSTLALLAELPTREAAGPARAHALLAVRDGPDLAEAHTALGLVHLAFDWDLQGARQELAGAAAKEPRAVIPLVAYAFYLQAAEPDASLPLLRQAEEQDPYAAPIPYLVGRAEYLARRPGAGLAALQRALALDPYLAAVQRTAAHCHAELGQEAATLDALLQERRLAGASAAMLAGLENARAVGGARGLWARLCPSPGARTADPVRTAAACARAGQRRLAIEWLRRGVLERAPGLLAVSADPAFSGLWGDPALDELLTRSGLPSSGVAKAPRGGRPVVPIR